MAEYRRLDSDSDGESDLESDTSMYDSGSCESFLEDIDSSDEDVASDNLNDARKFYEVDCENPPVAHPRFKFTGQPKVNFNFDDSKGKLQFYDAFIDNDLIDMIVLETNRYAEQCIQSSVFRRHSRSKKWVPTSRDEMNSFLALIILQGIVKKPTVEQYWSKRHSTSTPFFSKIMSYRRFQLIYRYMHFADNNAFDAKTHECPKLAKIWPVLKHLSSSFQKAITPERDVSIDESLMLFKGRLAWKQYIPLKRSRFGIKSYMLCESKTGYVWSLIIYTGKGTLFDDKYKHLCMSSQVVMTLMKPLLDKGYCVTTDNFYSSPELADILISRSTDTYGTIKLRRKEVPKELLLKKVKKGEIVAYQRGKVCIMKWMDKKAVSLISTIHNPEKIQTTNYKKEVKTKPRVVVEYNNTMGGVDRMDQNITSYPAIKKRGKRYYQKIFYHLLDISLWNAYVLYKRNGGKDSHLLFRLEIVDRLIERHAHVTDRIGRPGLLPNPMRLTERHFLEIIPPTEKKLRPARQCYVCSLQKNENNKRIRKETRYFCPDCDVGLCLTPCFKIYHTKSDLL